MSLFLFYIYPNSTVVLSTIVFLYLITKAPVRFGNNTSRIYSKNVYVFEASIREIAITVVCQDWIHKPNIVFTFVGFNECVVTTVFFRRVFPHAIRCVGVYKIRLLYSGRVLLLNLMVKN